jgi:hypothetical protein
VYCPHADVVVMQALHPQTDSLPSSREASEEPELLTTTTPERPVTQFSADTDSPRDGRKKRRFSLSSFHRSSRSRSRPNSIVLPGNTSFFSSTPKGTPPRELSRILGEEKGRPNSYHTPDSWNQAPGAHITPSDHTQSTPPRESSQTAQSRLGILPSPAKSAFSGHGEDSEVPPVPRIPDTMRLSNDLSHEILQSVIRYATPPIPAARPTTKSTVVGNDAPTQPDHGQWPLANSFQPGARLPDSDNDEVLVQRRVDSRPSNTHEGTGSRVSNPIGPENFDEDDQPPQLSYEPIVSSSKLDEINSLPAYLIPSHLDVSDDEDYPANRSSLHARGNALPPPTKVSSDEGTMRDQVRRDDGDEQDGLRTKFTEDAIQQDTQATPSETASTSMETSSIRTKNAPSHEQADGMDVGDRSLGSPLLREDKDAPATSGEDSRDQARSPAPVWFGMSDLQLPKTRMRGAEHPAKAMQQHASEHNSDDNATDGRLPEATTRAAQTGAGGLSPHEVTADPPRRVSAAPFQVVHAVEEYAASDSSFASWDCNSVIAKSRSGSTQFDDMRDDSDLTPVAQVPRIVQHGQADEAERSNGSSRLSATPNNYFGGHEIPSHTMHRPQQQSQDLTVPERSKSMLSMISSMVSEGGTPISPASSNAGRSTPSTIRRMQRDSPEKSALMSGRIPEESMTSNEDLTPTAKNDDFDLYADHNGIVKDVRDENGQPLRVPQAPESTQSTASSVSGAPAASETRSGDRPRYSTERPMSFISGSTDQDGRPQDQLNQSLSHGNTAPRAVTEQLPRQNPRGAPQPHVADMQRNGPQTQQSVQIPISSKDQFREASGASMQASVQSPMITSGAARSPAANGQLGHPGHVTDRSLQEPQTFGVNPGQQPMPQHSAVHRQSMAPDRDPRFQGQPNGPNTGPRNEYEFQQQMMRLQAQYPHPQGANGLDPRTSPQVPLQPAPKQQDKPSSLPKLSSVFKGLGGKLQGNAQHAAPHNSGLRPDMQPPAIESNRNASSHSGVSSLHPEQLPPTSREQTISHMPPNRPPSNGTESRFSRVSQGSTQVQPADSRVDLRKPANPMPFQGIPPQVLPQRVTMQSGQPQQYRASTNGLPDAGKKKRFSTLGNIFSRSSEAQSAKPKLSKEEKKAQKAQRHFTAPPMQVQPSQWPPQQPQFRPQQPGMPYPPGQYPPQPMHTTGPQFAPVQTMTPGSLQSAQSMDPYGQSQHYQQAQPRLPMQQQTQSIPPEQGSAYLRTRQLAEQHQAQKALTPSGQTAGPTRPSTQGPSASFDQHAPQSYQESHGPPPGGYYNPNPISPPSEQTAYKTSQAARLLGEQQRQQSPSALADRQQLQYQQLSVQDQEAYRALQAERLRLDQQRIQLELEQRVHAAAPIDRAHRQQESSVLQDAARGAPQFQPQQVAHQHTEHQHPVPARQHVPLQSEHHGASHDELLRAHHERQQLEQDLRSQQYADRVQPAPNHRSASGPLSHHTANAQAPISQRHVSTPVEPQYDTPQIPAAYSHVSGAFVSPRDREQQPHHGTPQESMVQNNQYDRQYSDPRMPSLSPQVSASSQMPPNNRTHSDASTVSVVSPITTPAQDVASVSPPPNQRGQQPRMSSISEVHQGNPERPWHLNFPEGATEQEIVRARQRQFMKQQFTAQQQQYAERAAQSPSPRGSSHSHSPIPPPAPAPVPQQQGGGFRELLPRGSPQPYQQPQQIQHEQERSFGYPPPEGHLPIQSEQGIPPAAYPLPMSPEPVNARSPAHSLGDAPLAPPPPSKSPRSLMHPTGQDSSLASSPRQQHVVNNRDRYEPSPNQEEHYPSAPPPPIEGSHFEQSLPDDEPPPSYYTGDGPSVPNDGMDKSRPDQPRPPNIATDAASRRDDPRPRQPSIGILQHPQPASMAASPARSVPDMGAESLRRQLLQQEEQGRMERIQRAQIQRAESEREKQERDAARARARELERSVSGGDRVGSIRSVAGSRNGGQPGWQQRRGSSNRQVFELPAVEDDEPAMRATSYPGQEWQPTVWTDD